MKKINKQTSAASQKETNNRAALNGDSHDERVKF